jgi:RND family efflux transporter MFP subunit
MKFSRMTLGVVTLVLVLGALGAGVYLRLQSPEGEGTADAEGAERAELPASAAEQFATSRAQAVHGALVVRDTLWITVSAAGQAEASRRTTLQARVAGVIREVPVRENGVVRAGQVTLAIDTTEYALAVARAESELLNAETAFRELILFDDEIADPELRAERERLARSRSGLSQAEVAVRQAELDLERTRVRSPFGGRVANLRVVPGQYVSQGAELMTIVDIDPIKVEVQVLEAELGYLSEGRRATVTFAAFPGETFTGRVETLNPVVDPETRTGRATLILPNPAGRIKPGMYARVSLDAQHFAGATMVPRSAILERDRRTMLFVYRPAGETGVAEWRYVRTGRESDTLVEIVEDPETSMVQAGEIVLTGGHQFLAHQALIQLVDEPVAATTPGVR